ncbi:MAG: hypothetical protein IMY67_01805 [Bacteroidetes bacterium]|nr:hypothetical protein [Bacteroidota bacterium]
MTKEEIKIILDEKVHKNELDTAINLQAKLSFLVETFLSDANVPYLGEYQKNIQTKINNDQSYNRFVRHLDFPLQINEFTEYIYIELHKIFEGQNSHFALNVDVKDKPVFDIEFYQNDLWSKYKIAPNTLVLLDYPEIQTTELTEVDKVLLNVSSVCEFKLKSVNSFEYLIFKTTDKLYFYDTVEILEFDYKDNNIGDLTNHKIHNLGFCPVNFISNEILNSTSDFVRSNKLVKSLTSLEDLQTLNIYKKLITPHSFYLFVEKFQSSVGCSYETESVTCEGGNLYSKNENQTPLYDYSGKTQSKSKKRCPECNEDLGIGNELTKSLNFIGDKKVIDSVLSFISPATDILDYGDKFILGFRNYIKQNIIGTESSLNSKVSHNKDAYAYNTESKETVLLNLKKDFEAVIKRIELQSLAIIYTEEKVKGATINLGTHFLLQQIDDLYSELENTEKYGLSEILEVKDSIIDTKFKTNPQQKFRAKVLLRFYPDLKNADLKFEKGLIPESIYFKHTYFSSFINWFESNKYELNNIDKNIDLVLYDLEREFIIYLTKTNDGFKRNQSTLQGDPE